MSAPFRSGFVLGVGFPMGQVKAGRETPGPRPGMPWLGLASPAGRPGTSAPAGGQRLSCGYARVPDAWGRVKSRTDRDADAGLLPPQPEVPHLDPANRVPISFSAGRTDKAENPLLARTHLPLYGANPISPSSAPALVLGYRGRAKVFTGYEKSAGKAVQTARRLPDRRVTLGTQPKAPLPGLGCAGRTTGSRSGARAKHV